jgi:hypothetical protein
MSEETQNARERDRSPEPEVRRRSWRGVLRGAGPLALGLVPLLAFAGVRGGALGQETEAQAPATAPVEEQAEGTGSPDSIWDGVYTAEQAERGATFYSEGCAECHGEGLQGDDMSPALAGADFLWDWNGMTVGDLFQRLVISMPEDDPKRLTTQQKADVVAFMLRENGIPAGQVELPNTAKDLESIWIEAAAPTDP